MKSLPLIIAAILIHVLIKLLWDFVSDDLYYFGMSTVMLLWVIAFKIKKESNKYLEIVVSFWLVWVVNDFLKEVSHSLNILTWLFANPTVKHLHEYIAFLISLIIVSSQIYRLKRAK